LWNHGWPSRPDMVEGLEVGRKLVALGRCCLSSLGMTSDGRPDYRCLTARYRIKSREAGLKTWHKRAARRSSNKVIRSNTSMALLDWLGCKR